VHAVDLRDRRRPDAVVLPRCRPSPRIDLLVNNAGSTKRGDFFELTDADWAEGYGLKFFAAMRLCRAAWPHLRQSRGSS
jgi:3-oxoacyl-[acyl-carrier protein] reductase